MIGVPSDIEFPDGSKGFVTQTLPYYGLAEEPLWVALVMMNQESDGVNADRFHQCF